MLVLLFLSITLTEEETEALRTIRQPDLTLPQSSLKYFNNTPIIPSTPQSDPTTGDQQPSNTHDLKNYTGTFSYFSIRGDTTDGQGQNI